MLNSPIPLDIPDGNSFRFTVSNFALDIVNTRPLYSGAIIQTQVLRIFPRNTSPQIADAYFDILSVKLINRLISWLNNTDYAQRIFTLTKHGSGLDSEWQLSSEMAT